MILHRYFANRFLVIFLSVTAIFTLFIGLIAYVEQLRQVGARADATQVAILTLFNLPAELYQIFPLIAILASLWFFLSLARSSELVISRAAGRSIFQTLIAPVAAMLFGWIKSHAPGPRSARERWIPALTEQLIQSTQATQATTQVTPEIDN